MAREQWRCLCCGRDKFIRPYQPHRCRKGGITKNFKNVAKELGINGPSFVKVENSNDNTST